MLVTLLERMKIKLMANLSEKKLSSVCVKCAQNTMRLNKKNGKNKERRGCDWHNWISFRKKKME